MPPEQEYPSDYINYSVGSSSALPELIGELIGVFMLCMAAAGFVVFIINPILKWGFKSYDEKQLENVRVKIIFPMVTIFFGLYLLNKINII